MAVVKTRALISAWGDANIQSQLDEVTRNCTVFQQISQVLLL